MDSDLCDFYFDVISKQLNLNDSEDSKHMISSTKAVKRVYGDTETIKNGGSHQTNFNFDSVYHRCSYLYAYSTCTTSVVTFHFEKLLKNNPMMLRKLSSRRQVDICCLGGGPGTEAVAVIKTLESLKDSVDVSSVTNRSVRYRVTVVDIDSGWETTGRMVVESLRNAMSDVFVDFKFLQADVTEPMSAKVLEVVRAADVLTMVRLMSSVGKATKAQKREIKMGVFENLKNRACFFFLDSAVGAFYEKIAETARNFEGVEQIYGPVLKDLHTVDTEVGDRQREHFQEIYKTVSFVSSWNVSVSAWTKTGRNEESSGSFKKKDQKVIVKKKRDKTKCGGKK